jgi:LmbE family N-acetylglucosaminyl deacetylase
MKLSRSRISRRKAVSPRRRRLRRTAALLGGIGVCAALPVALFRFASYRRNIRMAREKYPDAPAFSENDRLLVLSPHLDDETLGVGGLIAQARARGIAVRVVFLTNGDSSFSTRVSEDVRFLRRNTFRQLVAIRQQEALAAVAALGVEPADVVFLGYPDGGTKAMWEANWSGARLYRSGTTGASRVPYANARTPGADYCGQELLREVREIMEEFEPTAIFTTHPGDTHCDHWAAYAYACAALQQLRLQPETYPWAKDARLLTYMIHYGLWPTPHGHYPDAELSPPAALKNTGTQWLQVPLDDAARAAKKAALECYVSQLVFTPHYLRGFLRRTELLGVVPESTLATGSHTLKSARAVEPPAISDPVGDSLLREVMPAADLKTVSLVRSRGDDAFTLRVELERTPSRHLSYRFCLRTLGVHANGGAEPGQNAIHASTVIVNESRNGLRAVLHHAGVGVTGTHLKVRRSANGFEVDIAQSALCPQQPGTLLISASTRLGRVPIDQTEVGTVCLHGAADCRANGDKSPAVAH